MSFLVTALLDVAITLVTLTATQGQSDRTLLEEKNIENVSESSDDGFYNLFRVEWRNNSPEPQYQNFGSNRDEFKKNFDINRDEFNKNFDNNRDEFKKNFDINRDQFKKNFENTIAESEKTFSGMVWVGVGMSILSLLSCCLCVAACLYLPKSSNRRKQLNIHIQRPTSIVNEQDNHPITQGAYPTQPNTAPVSTYVPGQHCNIGQHQPGSTTFIQPSAVPGTVTMISGNEMYDPPPPYNPHLGIVGQTSSTFTNPGYPPTPTYYPHKA